LKEFKLLLAEIVYEFFLNLLREDDFDEEDKDDDKDKKGRRGRR